MIVVVVMGVITILLALVINLSGEAAFTTQMMATVRAQDRTYYVAQSAVTAVLPLLPNSKDSSHSLQDPWAIGIPPLKIDGYIVSVKISDEERFVNPNAMMPDGRSENAEQIKLFRRLLKNLGQKDEEYTNAILDWMDADSNRRLPGGAEGKDYGDHLPKNAALDSIDELLFVKDIPRDLLTGPTDDVVTSSPSAGAAGSSSTGGQVQRGLREFISIYGTGTVNVNTAPRVVLMSLADNLDSGLVDAIIERRERDPFKKMDDMLNVPGITRDHIYFLKKVADVKSTTWCVRVDVAVDTGSTTLEGPPQATLTAIYRGNGKGIKPLAWNLDEIGTGSSEEEGTPSPGESATPTAAASASGTPKASPTKPMFGGSPKPSGF